MREQIRRSLAHAEMKEVCEGFAKRDPAKLDSSIRRLVQTPLEASLATLASAFVQLQQHRHRADYDFANPITRAWALERGIGRAARSSTGRP